MSTFNKQAKFIRSVRCSRTNNELISRKQSTEFSECSWRSCCSQYCDQYRNMKMSLYNWLYDKGVQVESLQSKITMTVNQKADLLLSCRNRAGSKHCTAINTLLLILITGRYFTNAHRKLMGRWEDGWDNVGRQSQDRCLTRPCRLTWVGIGLVQGRHAEILTSRLVNIHAQPFPSSNHGGQSSVPGV